MAIDYHAIFLNSLDMISCHDCAGIYLDVSPSCRDLLGYEPSEMIGHSAYEFFHPGDLKSIRQSHDTIITKDVGTKIIYRFRKKNGEFTWFESASKCVSNAVDSRIYAYSRDVSNRVAFQILQTQMSEQTAGEANLVQICAWTGRVKHNGQWLSVQDYLSLRFGIRVSHSISQDAADQIIREFKNQPPG